MSKAHGGAAGRQEPIGRAEAGALREIQQCAVATLPISPRFRLGNSELPRALVSDFPAGAHFCRCRSLGAGEIVSGVDERDVAECLREIPHLAARAGVVFLGKQPHIAQEPKRPALRAVCSRWQ